MNLGITPKVTTNYSQPQKAQVKQNQSFGMYFPIYTSSVDFLRNDLKKVLPQLPEEIGKTLEQIAQKFLQKLGRDVVEHHNTPAQHAIYQEQHAITGFDIQFPKWLTKDLESKGELQDASLLNMTKAKSELLQEFMDGFTNLDDQLNRLDYIVKFNDGKMVRFEDISPKKSNLAQEIQKYFIEQKSQNAKTIDTDIDALVAKSQV